jgi:pantoate--beta-alanine ligase
LHAGHASLIRRAAEECDVVTVSVFLNPSQFAPGEDFASYPANLEGDRRQALAAGAEILFTPERHEIYPAGDTTRVVVRELTEVLCGPHRPGHFEGVATVVTKLFAATGPCTAFFGRKDYQQLKVVERLVRDLLLPVRVVGLPTVRESDGLAMSTRNVYLSPADRVRARALPIGLSAAARAFQQGERRPVALTGPLLRALTEAELEPDYVSLAEPDSLAALPSTERIGERALLAVAVRVGGARLIDNLVLGEDKDPLGDGR